MFWIKKNCLQIATAVKTKKQQKKKLHKTARRQAHRFERAKSMRERERKKGSFKRNFARFSLWFREKHFACSKLVRRSISPDERDLAPGLKSRLSSTKRSRRLSAVYWSFCVQFIGLLLISFVGFLFLCVGEWESV